MKKKFGVVTILYNPSEDDIKNLIPILYEFDYAYIYDNSEERVIDYDSELKNTCNFAYVNNGNNCGLAYCYNDAIIRANEEKLDYLCLLDQDSKISKSTIKLIKDYITKNRNNQIIVYAPYISFWEKNVSNVSEKIVKWVINSGSFLDVEKMISLGIRYDENYFLDRLDRDFCMQIEEAGYNICLVPGSVLWQQIGELHGKRVSHNSIRHYYIARNRLYFNRKFYKGIKKYFRNYVETFLQFLRVTIVEREEVQSKYKMIIKGIIDFKKGKMGKYNE